MMPKDDPGFDRWTRLRDSLQIQIEMMRSGRLRVLEGRVDATPAALNIARESLAAVKSMLLAEQESRGQMGGETGGK